MMLPVPMVRISGSELGCELSLCRTSLVCSNMVLFRGMFMVFG
jgi:hypothetical protein